MPGEENSINTSGHPDTAAYQKFLDSNQYSRTGIQRYERIFGEDFVSTGGRETTEEIVGLLHLKPGMKILDVGSGIGGSAFYMASHCNVSVEGLDLSKNMSDIAHEKLEAKYPHLKDRVSFRLGNALEVEYPEGTFDVIYSRDALLHVAEKPALFKRLYRWLKPGGRLVITDYCHGDAKVYSQEYKDYVEDRSYHLLTVHEYAQLLKSIFPEVWSDDRTEMFLEVLKKELVHFEHRKEAFIKEFSEADYEYIREGWDAKVKRSLAKEQAWGLFMATKH